MLLGALCFVFYTLGAREFPGWSPLRFTALSATLGSVTIVAITEAATIAGWSRRRRPRPRRGRAALGYMVVFGADHRRALMEHGLPAARRATAVLFNSLVPITAFVIAIAGGCAPNAYELGGAALAIVSLAAVTLLNRVPHGTGRVERRLVPATSSP